MDLALLLSTFVTVFLAELGDKTQLATVALSGTSDRPFAVFLGSSSALVLASLLGALAGGSMASMIPADLLQLAASIGFLVIGTRLLWPALRGANLLGEKEGPADSSSRRGLECAAWSTPPVARSASPSPGPDGRSFPDFR